MCDTYCNHILHVFTSVDTKVCRTIKHLWWAFVVHKDIHAGLLNCFPHKSVYGLTNAWPEVSASQAARFYLRLSQRINCQNRIEQNRIDMFMVKYNTALCVTLRLMIKTVSQCGWFVISNAIGRGGFWCMCGSALGKSLFLSLIVWAFMAL